MRLMSENERVYISGNERWWGRRIETARGNKEGNKTYSYFMTRNTVRVGKWKISTENFRKFSEQIFHSVKKWKISWCWQYFRKETVKSKGTTKFNGYCNFCGSCYLNNATRMVSHLQVIFFLFH
jgi:hypothetical protein